MADIDSLINSLTPEQIAECAAALSADSTPEQVVAFAAGKGQDITAEEAAELVERLKSASEEVSLDELDDLAGGGGCLLPDGSDQHPGCTVEWAAC